MREMLSRKTISLKTEVNFKEYPFRLNHHSGIITMGSCFSEVVGEFLSNRKFEVLSNPFGTVYNLYSIVNLWKHALGAKPLSDKHFVEKDGLFFHYDLHSSFYGVSKEDLWDKINLAAATFLEHLKGADLMILTFGTSYVYTFEEEIVNNCQKQPAKLFQKRLLSLQEQISVFEEGFHLIRTVTPDIQFLISVSPVRHIKDGVVENSLSKSLLRVLCDLISSSQVHYFPAYEVMLDELRDYRYYKEDLIHPSTQAEHFICSLFMECLVEDNAKKISENWSKIIQGIQHRPLQPGSESHIAFLNNLLKKIETFRPYFDVTKEWEEVKAELPNA
ncbi:GSCFA domain-containing protein [Leadbetterella byssophila]|uniref:GSCFA domain-containing protein n=1 Tax=Leadbetterella byssophila TaxID=316068 RepID=UPI0039A3B1D7